MKNGVRAIQPDENIDTIFAVLSNVPKPADKTFVMVQKHKWVGQQKKYNNITQVNNSESSRRQPLYFLPCYAHVGARYFVRIIKLLSLHKSTVKIF